VLIHRCAIQPLLTLNYQVQGMSLTGHTPPGHQAIEVSVGHLQQSASSAITGMTAAYSLNDGQNFQPHHRRRRPRPVPHRLQRTGRHRRDGAGQRHRRGWRLDHRNHRARLWRLVLT
jgi:hypothetical protein